MRYYDSFRKKLTPQFESGWLFFLPYIFLYWIFWFFPLPTSVLEWIFTGIHTFYFFALFICFYSNRRNSALYLWFGVFLVLLLPGAYLEFPADPWEHFRRIVAWDSLTQVRQSHVSTKFAYFWQWTFIRFLDLPQWRLGLTFLSAFWQTLLCYQVYRLARAFKFEKKWSYLQSFAFFCLFGTNLFGIRYYALSSTLLSMVALFAAIQVLIETKDGKQKRVTLGFLAFVVMLSNHPQTLIHFCLLITAFFLYRVYSKMKRSTVLWFSLLAFLIWVGSLLAGFYVRKYHPGLYEAFDIHEISRFGTLKVWMARSRYMETFGVHGILAILLALIFFRRMPLLSLFSLLPIWVLLFPPAIIILGTFVSVETPYRVLYAFPLSFVLVEGLRIFVLQFSWLQRRALVVVSLLVFSLAIPFEYPWRGRLLFQFAPTPEGRDYREVDTLASWMKSHRDYPANCRFISDDISGYVLFTLLGRSVDGVTRLSPIRIQKRIKVPRHLIWQMLGNEKDPLPLCAVIVRTKASLNTVGSSWIARSSGHWPESSGDITFVADELETVIKPLLGGGWDLILQQLRTLLYTVNMDRSAQLLPRGFRRLPVNSNYFIVEAIFD